jgi:glycosyltransferase involved in cell wall biosynthesis
VRILLLTQVVPAPPDSGPKIKTNNVLRVLAQRHEVHLVSFVRSAEEAANAASLAPLCRAGVTTVPLTRSRWRDLGYLARSLVTGQPFLIERDASAAMRAAIARLLREQRFDAVHADQLSMAQFALDLPLLRVLDEHNAVWTIVRRAAAGLALGPRRLMAELEWRKLRAYEGKLCRQFDAVTVVSEQDRADLAEGAGPGFDPLIIPIAVDADGLAFEPRSRDARHVVSVATMFYPPNVEAVHWFATEAFPAIRRARPDVEFRVVGSRPPAHIVDLAAGGSGVVVTGYVPDLQPILRESAVMVVPLLSGSGMRVKILEAFARGIPVVSTTIGVEGIDAVPGKHLLVADQPADFAAAVLRLIEHPAEAARLAGAARQLLEERYDWRSALGQLDRLYGAGADAPASGAAPRPIRAVEVGG